jgi:hypothetical protein
MALISNAAGTNIADVDTDNQLVATGPRLPGTAGFALLASEVDAGNVTGSRLALAVEASGDYRIRAGLDSFLLSERFPGTALNTSIWTAVTATMAVAVSAGSVILNSGPITTASTSARVQSWRNFPVFGTAATYFECIAQFAQLPQVNNVCEWGLGFATGLTDPTDGVFFRLNTAGQFVCVVSMGGTEVASVPLSFATLIGINTTRDFIIELSDDYVNFWVDDVAGSSGALENLQLGDDDFRAGDESLESLCG